MTRRILFLVVIAVILWLTAPLQASGSAAFVFQTDMFGSEQVPPVTTGAWGFVRFFFSEDRLQADYTVDVKGLSGTLIEGADIHRGTPGANGPAIRHLADGGFIVTAGHLTLSQAELDEMVSGAWYVSLSTKDHPGGELRGQILVPDGFLPRAGAAAPAAEAVIQQPQSGSTEPERAAGAGPAIQAPNTGDAGLAATASHVDPDSRALPALLIAAAMASAALLALMRLSAERRPVEQAGRKPSQAGA